MEALKSCRFIFKILVDFTFSSFLKDYSQVYGYDQKIQFPIISNIWQGALVKHYLQLSGDQIICGISSKHLVHIQINQFISLSNLSLCIIYNLSTDRHINTQTHTHTHTHIHTVIAHAQQKMLFIWLTAQKVRNNEYVLLTHGNLPYQILKTHEIIKHFIEKCNDPRVSFMYLQFLIWIF